ncbi:MAG: chorismate mutase [Lutisporaceae bacterium]
MVSIRGATTIKKDVYEEILFNTRILLENIIKKNELNIKYITAIFFSCTKDITAAYPAIAARELGITNASLMCFQEMNVKDSLENCIRLCVYYDDKLDQASIKHIYLNEAMSLRMDLIQN